MDIQKHYDSVEKFNDIAGNLDNVDVESINAQMKVVVEEIKELQEAFDNKDAAELLDGACDGFVTLMGLLQQMKQVGFKVDEALTRVNLNNLSKFPQDMYEEDVIHYTKQGWETDYNPYYQRWVLKDANGKIRKPRGFVPVALLDLVPEGFFKEQA